MLALAVAKVLLTVFFVETSLMLAFLKDSNISKSLIDIYDELYNRLEEQDFQKLFPIILTDNGSEFSNPKSIEYGPDGKGFQRTRIYYCNPSAPYQKNGKHGFQLSLKQEQAFAKLLFESFRRLFV